MIVKILGKDGWCYLPVKQKVKVSKIGDNEVAECDYQIESPTSLTGEPALNSRLIIIDNYRIEYSGNEAYLLENGKTIERL